MKKRIAIIIINYKTPDLTIDCLKSIKEEIDKKKDKVILIDNFSNDSSCEKLENFINKNKYNSWLNFIKSSKNLGFALGNNLGIKSINADYYLLLNSDTIVKSGLIKNLLKAATENTKAGIIGPMIKDAEDHVQLSYHNFLNPLSEFIGAARTEFITKILKKYDINPLLSIRPKEVQWISFACVLIKKKAIKSIGLLDDYFMYFDDVDYCRRAWKNGWHILYWPKTEIIHFEAVSSKIKESSIKRKPKYYYESRSKYFAKFYSIFGLWIANIFWMTGRIISLSREIFFNRKKSIPELTWLDIWTNCLSPSKKSKYQ